MRKHALAPRVACGFRGSSGLGSPRCRADRRTQSPTHPPQSYASSTGGHAGCMCCIILRPKMVPALAKPLSLASDTSVWELTALPFNLIVSSALFVFGTKVLDYSRSAGHYLCLHSGIFHSSPVANTCPGSVGCLRSKRSAGCVQHDPSSGWQ